jgi:hypothetical protein
LKGLKFTGVDVCFFDQAVDEVISHGEFEDDRGGSIIGA